jgi:hypothetical protein
MNSALLTISAALLWLLIDADPGHAIQAGKGQDHGTVVAADFTPTSCAVTGKGRTRAHCENHRLPGSGTIAAEKSQYLSTVILATVSGMLIVIMILSGLSLALIAVAAWARRTRHQQPVEKTAAYPSLSRQGGRSSQWALRPTLWHTIRASLFGLAWLAGIVSLIWSLWFVWFI